MERVSYEGFFFFFFPSYSIYDYTGVFKRWSSINLSFDCWLFPDPKVSWRHGTYKKESIMSESSLQHWCQSEWFAVKLLSFFLGTAKPIAEPSDALWAWLRIPVHHRLWGEPVLWRGVSSGDKVYSTSLRFSTPPPCPRPRPLLWNCVSLGDQRLSISGPLFWFFSGDEDEASKGRVAYPRPDNCGKKLLGRLTRNHFQLKL